MRPEERAAKVLQLFDGQQDLGPASNTRSLESLIAKAITEAEDEMIDRAARIIAPKPRDAEWLSRLTADARARIKDSDLEAISCAHAISNLKSKQGT